MEQLRSIVGIPNNNYENMWEGDIIVRDQKEFEGIVRNPLNDDMQDKYISGELKDLNNLIFGIGTSDLETYDVTRIAKGVYTGSFHPVSDEEANDCVIRIRTKMLEKNQEQAEINILKQLINIHKNMSTEQRMDMARLLQDADSKVLIKN